MGRRLVVCRKSLDFVWDYILIMTIMADVLYLHDIVLTRWAQMSCIKRILLLYLPRPSRRWIRNWKSWRRRISSLRRRFRGRDRKFSS